MGKDDRRAAGLDRILHRCRRDVAEVDQHAEPVHLADHLDAERAEAVIFWIVGRAVGPFGGLVVGQRHVARAQIVVLAQRGERAADLPAAFDADHRGDLPRPVDAHDVVGGRGQLEVRGISRRSSAATMSICSIVSRIAASPVIVPVM